MKKEIKIAILVILTLVLVGIYFGKNVYAGKGKSSSQSAQEIKFDDSLPTMIEFKTDT